MKSLERSNSCILRTLHNSSPSSYLPPLQSDESMKFSLSQKTRKGERIFFETPSLSLSSNENHHRSLRPSNPLERQFRFVSRESRSSPLDRRRSKITAVLSRNPSPSSPPFSRPFPFLFPAGLLIQLSRVPCRDQCATPLVCGVWTGGPFVL